MENSKMLIFILLFISFSLLLFAQAPEWQWVTQAGGSDNDKGNAIAIDNNGNCYVTGRYWDTATFGSYSLSSNGEYDIFVAKLDATGNCLWAIKAGGSDWDQSIAITIDDNGNSYVTGSFQDTATFGSYSLTGSGFGDIFVAKLDATGNWLWAAQAGGSNIDKGFAIAIDENGNSYVTGALRGTATFGTYSLNSNGGYDIFVAKLDATGNWLWATKAGGGYSDAGLGIAIDENGNSYVTGSFNDMATFFGSYSLTGSGGEDIFIAKMDATGNWLWATSAGGSSNDYGCAITIDENGNSYVTGYFKETATFDSYSLTSSGHRDIFVAKMDATGNWLWATKAGGGSADVGLGIAIDENGNSYVTGYFEETATFGSYSLTGSGDEDIFVAKMDATGNWLWATKAGGGSADVGSGIAIDENGNSYVTGYFYGTATFGSYSHTGSGGSDIFVAKLGNYTSVENEIIPKRMELSNYPNPFNPTTTIRFELPLNVTNHILEIFNVKGQLIDSFTLTENQNSLQWNAEGHSSGIYLYRIKSDNQIFATSKMVLLK